MLGRTPAAARVRSPPASVIARVAESRLVWRARGGPVLPGQAVAADQAGLGGGGRAGAAAKEQERVKGGYPEWPQPDVVDLTAEQLQTRAMALDIEGRSNMTKDQLVKALR